MYEFKESTEKSVTQDSPRKDESSQQPEQHKSGHEKRNASRRFLNWIPDWKWKGEILRPGDYIPSSRNDRNQESCQDSLGDVSQIQAGADFKNFLLKHRLRLFDASNNSDEMLRTGEHGPPKKSAQRKMLRLIIQTKRRYEKIVKHKVKTSEDMNDIDLSCTNDESEDGKSDTSYNDKTVTCHSRWTMMKK